MRDLLLHEANEWLVRLHGAPSPEDWVEHAAWLERSPAHGEAWAEAEHGWALLGALGGDAAAVNASIKSDVRRRRTLRATAAAVVLAFLLLGNWAYQPVSISGMLADASTRPGEKRELRLDDGTRITMNGATRLDWDLRADRRDVVLASGEAFFEVTHDSARPFYVRAGNARIRVTGTRFSVRRPDTGAVLELEQGMVLASSASDGVGPVGIAISPGQRVTWDVGGKMVVKEVNPDELASWRGNLLIVRARPLGDVLDELNLVWGRRIIVSRDVARLAVTGVFVSGDMERSLADLEQSLPIRVTRFGPLVFVRKRA